MQDLRRRITLLARARYPLIQLVSHEEVRIERTLEKLAETESLPYWRWTATMGLRRPDGSVVPETESAAQMLRAVHDHQDAALFVLLDLHMHARDPLVIRYLRDLARTLGPRKQALVSIAPAPILAADLEKDTTVIDISLPNREEVSRVLSVLLKSRRLDLPRDRFERFVRGSLGLTENEIKRLYARILLAGGRFTDDDLAELIEEKRHAIRRSRFLELWEGGTSMGDVGGLSNLKRWLQERQAGFTEAAQTFGLPEPKGVFLLGVQGCGKSLIAKAVADRWQLPLLRLDVAALFRSTTGEEIGLRETVRIAESLAPAVLWIDEIEKGFGGRNDAGGEGFGWFLTWMQEKTKPVFVVATANEVRQLPPELLRKGRFDEIFFVDLPNVHERLNILEIHLRRRKRDPNAFDLVRVAESTEKFSGAELEQVVISALFTAFSAERQLDSADLIDTAREMVPLAVTMDDRLKDLREWARPRARPATLDRRRIDFFEDWTEEAV
ncbi:MAG TPA: ATPase [Deltaproteobacteria bacterium]|nr:ATPase [Deltaproteobacteria bacterium]